MFSLPRGEVGPIFRYWDISLKGQSGAVIEILIKMHLMTIQYMYFLQNLNLFSDCQLLKCFHLKRKSQNVAATIPQHPTRPYRWSFIQYHLSNVFVDVLISRNQHHNGCYQHHNHLEPCLFAYQVPTSELILRPKEVSFLWAIFFWLARFLFVCGVSIICGGG